MVLVSKPMFLGMGNHLRPFSKPELSLVDCLPGSAFNFLIWGSNFEQWMSILYDIIQTLQCGYCVWVFVKWLHSKDSCVQIKVLHMCGCGRLVDLDSDDDGDNDEIDNELEVNNYFTVPSAPPPKYEA